MAERRTRHHNSPRRRRRESTKAIIDQDEVPRTRAPYQPEEISSSYSSSSSYIDISRTFPPNRPRGLGAIRAFFTSPSEHRRRPRRRTSRPYLRGGTSSSSSINTDLAYGSGYIRRRKGDKRRGKGKERDYSDRRDPRAEKDPDAAILEVGAGLAALAKKQNRLDVAEARKQGTLPPKRSDSSFLKKLDSSRGLASSKVSHGPDEEGWESASDADSETSSVDSRLAYGNYSGPRRGFFRSGPKRKDSVVDPALFGPANSLHGIINEPVGFNDVDYDNLSDCPPPTVAALQRQQSYPPPPTIAALQGDNDYPPQVPPLQREQGIASGSASATGPMQYVYPVPTSNPTIFDAEGSSVISAQDPYGPRAAPVPIQQPQPKPIVPQSVFEPPYSTKSEPKVPSSSGRTKSSVAGAALAGVAGAAIVGAMSSDRRDERKDRERTEDVRDSYDVDRRAEDQKKEPRERRDMKENVGDRRDRRYERDHDGPEESREERRARRRREARDDPDYKRRERRRAKRPEDDMPDDDADRSREDKYEERTEYRDDVGRTRKDAPIVPPVDPFQYQVADDAFQTPDGTRNSEPLTSIQRARSPAVVMVDRIPHWHPDASAKKVTVESTDNAESEKDREARDRQQTEQEAESLYEEIEHSTIPVEASAVSAAIVAEENRYSREKVRKRRYDRSGDASPTGERDPIQEEADRIYREAVLARKISESKHSDPVARVVTPPEMAHRKEKEVLYPVPNADFELDHVMDPVEFMTSPIGGPGEGFDRIKSISGVAVEDLKRPLLTLVRPTPTPSPNPEEQKSRSKHRDSPQEVEPPEPEKSEPERKESSRNVEPSETVDIVTTESKGEATQTPTSANGTKGVTWGENDTKHYEVESPYETKDDPIVSSVKASDTQEKPKMSEERKASAWGALRGAFMSGAAAEVVAKATEGTKDQREPQTDRRENDIQSDTAQKDVKPDTIENSQAEQFEYRGVVVELEHSDNEARERGPPAVGPKPSKMPSSNMPGAFEDDLEFTATLAAGLKDSGFDPDIVIKDPTYRRRSSPPGSEDPPLTAYKQTYAETEPGLGQFAIPSTDRSRDIKAQDDDRYAKDRTEREQRKLDKAAKRQNSEPRDLDLSGIIPVPGQLVEEPESLESSKPSKEKKKRDKSKKSKDSYGEVDDRSNKGITVPVDAFDDLRTEAVNVEDPADWVKPKKSTRKPKRDSDQYDSPSRSMSASDMASVEQPKKSKDKSSRRSSQYDPEPNPEDVPLPSASEISRDDDYDTRKSRRPTKGSGSISDVADRDARSVKSDSSRYAAEDDSRSSKKEKKNSGFFSGMFGSSTSKSEPERSRDTEDFESKKKKSKGSSTGDGSEIYSSDAKDDVKTSPNRNGYKAYDDDDADTRRSMNGDSKRRKADEKEESFLDNAGTLGAGVGLAAAIALAAQHQQSKAATAEIEERVSRRSTPEHASPAETLTVEASREVFGEDIVDPEIVQRQFRPSIDPQYGDLLPLPPSNPGSPNVEPGDALPSLPETPPGTPPEIENVPARDRSVGSNRRSELPALVKTPSQSAIPIQYIMGNRSTPSSPGIVRALPTASPSTMSPDTHGFHRARSRPTSWDSTKEIKQLYLLDPSRRAPPSQSTDSEIQSPVAEDVAKSTQIGDLMHISEAAEDTKPSDVRSFAEGTQLESPGTHLRSSKIQSDASVPEFQDPITLHPLPKSRTTAPMGREVHDYDLSSLPSLPRSGTSTPADSFDLSNLPQLPDSRSSTPIEDRSLHDPDLAAAHSLTGAALGLSAAALASVSSRDEPDETRESAPKPTSTEELPAEFHIEPITKDRSSYLFQATPPTKGTKDFDIELPLETRQANSSSLHRTVEEDLAAEDVTSDYHHSPIRVRSVERDAALEALTRSVPEEEEEEPSKVIAPVQSAAADEVEVNAPDEFSFTKPKNGQKKGKKQADLFGLEGKPSSSTITPPSTADFGKDVEGPLEFSLKKSKRNKKKDKKRGSSQWDTENEPLEKGVVAPAIEAATLDRDIVDGPLSSGTVPPAMEPLPDNAETVEEPSFKKSKDKKDKKRTSTQMNVEDESSESTILVPSTEAATQDRDVVDEPSQLVSIDALPSSVLPAPEDPEIVEEYSLKKSKKNKKMDKKKAFDLSEPGSDDSRSTSLSLSIASAVKEVDAVDEPSKPFTGTVLPSSVELAEDIDTGGEFSIKKSKEKKKGKGKTLDSVEPEDNASLSTVMIPSTLREVDTFDEPSEPLSEIPLLPSIKPTDDETPEEFSLRKSKKSKRDKKKALDLTEGRDELSPITVPPISVSSAAQELDPSDEYSSTTSKKDKKKDKKNRKSLSRSSTLVEPDVGEPTQISDAKDEDLSKAERTLLPASRALSEIGAGSELGNVDTQTRDILPSQEESLQPAEPETASAKESKKSKKKGRKPSPSWELDEPSAPEAITNEPFEEPITEPIEREVEAFDSKSKGKAAIQDEPQIELQAGIIPPKESEIATEEPFTKPQDDVTFPGEHKLAAEEPPTKPQDDVVLTRESDLAAEEPLTDKPVQVKSVKGEQVQKEIEEAEPDLELPLLAKPIEGNAARELSMPDVPVREELANRDLGVEDSGRGDTTAAEDGDQAKAAESLFESGNTKNQKKSKKKKIKSFQAWQGDETPESQSTIDPVSEPTTAAPSEREDLSGFSTPTSKSKGKKKQKRKPIAWDIQEPETEPSMEAARSTAASDLGLLDATKETDQGIEVVGSPRHELGETITVLQNHDIKEEIGHVQESKLSEEVTPNEPEVGAKEIKESLARTGSSMLSATPTESEPFGTARRDFSGVEYFPSAASLHSLQVPKDLGESVKTGYFPSVLRLLPAAAPILAAVTPSKALEPESNERPDPEDASLSTTTVHEVVAEPLGALGENVHHEYLPVDEPSSSSREVSGADAQPPSPVDMRSFPEPITTNDLPKQTNIDYFPSATFLHSPSSATPGESVSGRGYFPSATTLLPLVGAAAILTKEHYREQEPLAKEVGDEREPLPSRALEYDEQPLPAADPKAAVTTNSVIERDVLEPKSQLPDEEGDETKPSTPYSEEQLEAARQLNAEFGSGKKKSRKNKKGRADLSRTSTQDDYFLTQVANEPEEEPEQTGFNREIQAAKEAPTAGGLAVGYKEDQVALAKQLQAEFDAGTKKSKKGKKSRSTSRTPRDYESGSPFFEEPHAVEEFEAARTQPAEELGREIIPKGEEAPRKQSPDGLAAGFTPEQLETARQMREDFATGSKKSKKDKKSRSTSRTPREYDSGPSFEEIQTADIQPVEETSREIIPEDEDAPRTLGPDGLAASFTGDQLEAARQMREDFAYSSKKSKKDKKRKSLIRSATDENISGPVAEGGSEETSLATTEVDSATDTPYPLSTAPTPDDLESSFTKKKGKKGKKRQSLLRSFTQDSEDSAGPSHGIAAEPEPVQLNTPGKDFVKAADIAPEPITCPEEEPSSAAAEEPETSYFSTKKGKKGNQKQQSLLHTATQKEEPSSDPTSSVVEPESAQKEIAKSSTSQPLGVIADDDIAALGKELNFSLKKSKDKKAKKGKDVDEEPDGTGDVSQSAEQGVVTERDMAPKTDREEGSLADQIWARTVPSESIQPVTENPSAEPEDPLGLYATKKSKNKKKDQAKLTSVPADRDVKDPGAPMDGESKELPPSWADRMAEGESENKLPKLFDTWSFSNLPLDETEQETSAYEPQTTSKDFELVHDIRQEPGERSHVSLPTEDDRLQESTVQEPENLEPTNAVETPPPTMPKALAWEDEPAQQHQQPEVKEADVTKLPAPGTEGRDAPSVKGKAKQGVANPVSVGILAAGAAFLAGASMGHGKEPTEAEPLSTSVPRSAVENNESNTLRHIESEKKREKRPAKLLDHRPLPMDDLFDNPMLWEGPEAQKFGDHMIEDEAGDDTGFWSAPVEGENTNDDFAVDDVEDGPSRMPHKRGRSESLMDVWEASTVLDHIKTPRKHQYEDVPAAMARDTIMEQEKAEEQSIRAESLNRDVSEEGPARIDNSEPVSQWNDVPEDILTRSSKEAKNKKQSHLEAWDVPAKGEETDVRPFVDEPESHVQRLLDEETFHPSRRGHEESEKDMHRHQEIYLPPPSTTPRAIEDQSVLRRELGGASPQPPSEGRAKDKHNRQESYLPPPPALPVVIEEEYHNPESEHIAHELGINDNNRDSAFVAGSPVPFQRRKTEDHEYARDSGVHLRDWGDTPTSKEKPHVASVDDALACLSWPTVSEEAETVDLKRSQRPKDEQPSKGHAANPALLGAGAVAVTELAHLAARSPPQNKYEHGDNAKVDRSITPNMGRLQTPDHSKYRPGSVGSIRSSGTPPLRRSDRKLSGDLRSLSQRSQANLAKEAKDAKEAERSPATSIVNINPIANEGRPRVKDMADVYDGYGEGRIGSPMSPTRPHSMRRRQSMQVLDLEARVEQLAAENRMLAEAKELAERSLQSSQRATLALADRDAEVDNLKQSLDMLYREVERLKEINDGLTSANITLGRQHNERYDALESQHADATRELEDLRQKHRGLSGGIEDVVIERVAAATEEKDREIAQLRQDLEAAHERIRELQREILTAKNNDSEFLVFRDEDYFDNECQQLCQHVRQWVLRFSKFSDMRACRRTNEINNDKIIDRLDNAVLDGSDVDEYLSDRVKRRDIFMSMTMTMIWEFVFTRYLFGMDREQRQKLKSLEKTLLEVGPPAAVHQWRATTLTLLSKREAFQQQRERDTVAVVQMIFQTLSEILPPPTHLEEQIQEQLMRVMKAAVDLSIEMRTQRAEYMMLPPLQPEYDANGDLARQVQFNAALMNERSGDTVTNEELEAQRAVVRIVLFPLVVKKGDDSGSGDDEIVVCPAQVLVAKPKRHARGLTPEGLGQNPNHSKVSMQSNMPVDQRVPDI